MSQGDPNEDLRLYLPSRHTADRVARGEIWKTPPLPEAATLPGEEPDKRDLDHPGVAVPAPRGRKPRRAIWISVAAAACVLLPVVVLLLLLRSKGDGHVGEGASASAPPDAPRDLGSAVIAGSSRPATTRPSVPSAEPTAAAQAPSAAAGASTAPTAAATAAPPKGGAPKPEPSAPKPDPTGGHPAGGPGAAPVPAPRPSSFDPLMNE